MDVVFDNFGEYAEGFRATLALTALSALLAFALGTVLAAMRVSPVAPLRAAGLVYVEMVRNCPLTIVFFLLVFGLPNVGITYSLFGTAVTALALYTAAFVCEALRAGINAVGAGQAEAARAIGLTFTQTLSLIVLPQALRTVVPPLGNVFIALAKNTSIAAAFGVVELTAIGQRLSNTNSDAVVAVFIGVALAYLVITLTAGLLLGLVERRTAIAR